MLFTRRRSQLFARILAVGTIAVAVFAAYPGATQAAGLSGWAGSHQQPKRPLFRPWQERAQTGQRQMRWRPQQRSAPYAASAPRYHVASRQPALIVPDRAPAPVTRAFARSATTGVRFRPNSRSVGGPPAGGANPPVTAMPAPGIHSQFRPETRQRLPYERLQAHAGTTQQFRTPYVRSARHATASAVESALPHTGYWRTW